MRAAARPTVAWSATTPILLLALAAAAWTVVQARGKWTASGTMGMVPVRFTLMWSVMMVAMMLPSMAPVASVYLGSIKRWKAVRGTLFVGGYALLWSGSGIGAYGMALAADHVVGLGGLAPRLFAAATFGASALYYLSSVKYRLLGQCRNPLGLLIQYRRYRGTTRDLRAGLHHGLTCLGCCWSLMALMVVFGAMNVAAMVVLGLVVALEKYWGRGIGFARGVGAVSAVLALAVLFVPQLAAALTGVSMGM